MKREVAVGHMRVALERAKASKCQRAKYCTLIFDDRGIQVSSGINGKPMSSQCDDYCFRMNQPVDSPAQRCCLHSEQNAIVFGDFHRFRYGTMVVTGRPCGDCALLIAQTGITELYHLEDDRGYKGLEEFEKHGIVISIEEIKKAEL